MAFWPAAWFALAAAAAASCLLLLARDRRIGGTRRAALTPLRTVAVGASMIAGCTAATAALLERPADSASARAADVVVLLDVSMSMLASDVAPSRLAAARAQLTGLFEADRTLRRVALVAFAGDARVACPLTTDRQALLEALASISEEGAAGGGSDLDPAFERALSIVTPRIRRATIVLVTDGERGPEPGAGQDAEIARRLVDAGIELAVVGVGSDEGGNVPVRGNPDAVAVDASGRPHRSTLDEARLQAMAVAARGRYHRLTPAGVLGVELPGQALQDGVLVRPFGRIRGSMLALLVALAALVLDTMLWWWRGSPEIWA